MDVVKKILHNKTALLGLILVTIILIFAVFADLIITHDPTKMDLSSIGAKPSGTHYFGTDELGRDIFSRVILGARTSLLIGVFVVLMGSIAGTIIGTLCGYYGGALDSIVMKIMDIMMAFPTILLALFFITIMGTGLMSAIVGVGLASVPRFARLVRGSVLSIKEKEYVEAARAIGQNNLLIILKHILPNCIGPIIVQATLTMGNSIITVAGLGFLGMGAKPGEPEWGAMLSDARSYLRSTPHIATFPGVAIALTVLGFNLLGDGLRDVLDVRQK